MLNASFDQSGGEKYLLHLGASEELFRLLVDQVEDAIFALNPDGYIVTWNKGAQLLKGYRAEEIIGQHMQRFYTEPDQQAGKPLKLLKQTLEHRRVEDDGWRVRKDGSQFWADVIITALVDEKQNLRGYAKVTRDLTERRHTEESLKEAKNALEKRVADRTLRTQRSQRSPSGPPGSVGTVS